MIEALGGCTKDCRVPLVILLLFCGATVESRVLAQELASGSQSDSELVIPAGTTLPIISSSYLNTRSTQVGDTFYADTAYPIWIQQ